MRRLQLDNNLIKTLYEEGLSTYEVANRIGTHQSLIHNRLKEMGVETRTIRQDHFNEHYFDKIDSRKKAYFLGFWYADGWNNTKDWVIGMELQEPDGYIMKEFLNDIGSNRELKLLKAKKATHQNKYSCLVYSKYMSQKLAELGCESPKSLTLTFPSEEILPKEFYPDFLRGYFDGDGCIGKCTSKKDGYTHYKFSLVGTLEFMTSCRNIFMKDCNIKETKLTQLGKNNTFAFGYHGNNCIKVREYLYRDAEIYLHRKYDKFFEVPIPRSPQYNNKCKISSCDEMSKSNGYCQSHYDLKRRNFAKFQELVN